jgi:hypothetical protein
LHLTGTTFDMSALNALGGVAAASRSALKRFQEQRPTGMTVVRRTRPDHGREKRETENHRTNENHELQSLQ